MSKTYRYDEIFTERDDGELDMKLPDEVVEQLGLKEGDTVKFEIGDKGGMIISKVDKNKTA